MSVLCVICFLLLIPLIHFPVTANFKLELHENKVALFIFGDSLFDFGANNYINTSKQFRANFSPYGDTFFKYPSGRSSNGRLIPDFIADYIRIPLIIPYMHPNYKFNGGANFASAGAGALVETHAGFVVDLETQLKQFKKLVKKLKNELSNNKAKKTISEAVYMFSIGANDYAVKPSTIHFSHSHEQYTAMVIGNLTNVLTRIYAKGGRKFVLMNVPPIGCFPGMRNKGRSSCSKNLNMVAKIHNAALSKALEKMQTKINGFNYSIFELYNTLAERIIHPSTYGLKEGKKACCGSASNEGMNSCGRGREGKDYHLCKDPNKYVFFDSAHPTQRIYKQLAKLMWSGGRNVIRPFNLKTLFML